MMIKAVLMLIISGCVLAHPLIADEFQIHFRNEANAIHIVEVTPKEWTRPRRRLIIFATPNGNTAEQSYGARAEQGRDWHFDIQHIGAQFRYVHSQIVSQPSADTDCALVILQPGQLSWPAFRQSTDGADRQIRRLIESLQAKFQADETCLTCHSGGGSLLWGWMNAHEQLPSSMTRLVWLDANYSYSDELKHGDKLLAWLRSNSQARLCVMAYDDRRVEYQGKRIVSDDGGTHRATQRMIARMQQEETPLQSTLAEFQTTSFLNGRALYLQHPNPQNIILHTALVGEKNGFAFACLWNDPNQVEALLAGLRCYTAFVADDPLVDTTRPVARRRTDQAVKLLELPPRDDSAETGSAFIQRVKELDRSAQQAAIASAILSGNVPDSARRLIPLECKHAIAGQSHQIELYVLQDYLAVGNNEDFVRMPMTPQVASQIADKLNCCLPTARLCDLIFEAANVRLNPQPLQKNRDQPDTFLDHQRLIEKQLQSKPQDGLVVGHKKDVIHSNLLLNKPHRVALYGWHYPTGIPIQPIYAGHVDSYTDYSHGVRLIANHVTLDGQPYLLSDLLKSNVWHELLSSEGPIDIPKLREFSGW